MRMMNNENNELLNHIEKYNTRLKDLINKHREQDSAQAFAIALTELEQLIPSPKELLKEFALLSQATLMDAGVAVIDVLYDNSDGSYYKGVIVEADINGAQERIYVPKEHSDLMSNRAINAFEELEFFSDTVYMSREQKTVKREEVSMNVLLRYRLPLKDSALEAFLAAKRGIQIAEYTTKLREWKDKE